ncbi:MAG: carbamoyl-phosphate synthase large subunit, partial [Candidatus Doudnabacteria bacterium CG10_big_fil_rev_8_21_14_0_10_41_10]
LQKAVRMLNLGQSTLQFYPYDIENLKSEIKHPTYQRLFAIYKALRQGISVEKIHELSKIDKWFLYHIKDITDLEKKIVLKKLDGILMSQAKKMGFSDVTLAKLKNKTPLEIRSSRLKLEVKPVVKQIDTLAGEFPAQTNYLYVTYHGTVNDVAASPQKPIIVLGSGPYSIGSSVEFDWCAVNTAKTLKRLKKPTVIINSNPETVSTDYDESDRLYFEELTLERVQDIYDAENADGVIISMGGQIPNNLSLPLSKAGYKILGTVASSIDQAENREKFSSLLNRLKVDQPRWQNVKSLQLAKKFAKDVGYPLLVRPSYVLSGAAMNVVHNDEDLENYLKDASIISKEHPVVISEFITNARELEIDGVGQKGKIVIEAISEHVENAGVHSGDATVILPPQKLYLETIRRAKTITAKIVKALNISGPFNIQFIAKDNRLRVIECNLRASRSFPFVSKVTGHNFIQIATEVILNKYQKKPYETLELNHIGVKMPQFSYQRLKGANPIAHVEMASTGEVACLADSYLEAFLTSWLATEQDIIGKKILLSIGGEKNKIKLFEGIESLEKDKWEIFATEGTHEFLSKSGIGASFLYKVSDGLDPNVASMIEDKKVNLIINIPKGGAHNRQTDGYRIRRLATDHNIPLITNVHIAETFLKSLSELNIKNLPIKSWRQFIINK